MNIPLSGGSSHLERGGKNEPPRGRSLKAAKESTRVFSDSESLGINPRRNEKLEGRTGMGHLISLAWAVWPDESLVTGETSHDEKLGLAKACQDGGKLDDDV